METRPGLFSFGLIALAALLFPALSLTRKAEPPKALSQPAQQATSASGRPEPPNRDALPDALMPLWEMVGPALPDPGRADRGARPFLKEAGSETYGVAAEGASLSPTYAELRDGIAQARIRLRILLATVPDPQVTGLDLSHDQVLRGLTEGFTRDDGDGIFLPDRRHLPWKSRKPLESGASPWGTGEAWVGRTGSLLFRRSHVGRAPEVWLCLLVGESPRLGVDRRAFQEAVAIHRRLSAWPAVKAAEASPQDLQVAGVLLESGLLLNPALTPEDANVPAAQEKLKQLKEAFKSDWQPQVVQARSRLQRAALLDWLVTWRDPGGDGTTPRRGIEALVKRLDQAEILPDGGGLGTPVPAVRDAAEALMGILLDRLKGKADGGLEADPWRPLLLERVQSLGEPLPPGAGKFYVPGMLQSTPQPLLILGPWFSGALASVEAELSRHKGEGLDPHVLAPNLTGGSAHRRMRSLKGVAWADILAQRDDLRGRFALKTILEKGAPWQAWKYSYWVEADSGVSGKQTVRLNDLGGSLAALTKAHAHLAVIQEVVAAGKELGAMDLLDLQRGERPRGWAKLHAPWVWDLPKTPEEASGSTRARLELSRLAYDRACRPGIPEGHRKLLWLNLAFQAHQAAERGVGMDSLRDPRLAGWPFAGAKRVPEPVEILPELASRGRDLAQDAEGKGRVLLEGWRQELLARLTRDAGDPEVRRVEWEDPARFRQILAQAPPAELPLRLQAQLFTSLEASVQRLHEVATDLDALAWAAKVQAASEEEPVGYPSQVAQMRLAREGNAKEPSSNALQSLLEEYGNLPLPKGEARELADARLHRSPLSSRMDDLWLSHSTEASRLRKDVVAAFLATDPRDALFLAHRYRLGHPGGQVLVFGSDWLHTHPDFTRSLRGAYAVSLYAPSGCMDSAAGARQWLFQSDFDAGAYNGTRLLRHRLEGGMQDLALFGVEQDEAFPRVLRFRSWLTLQADGMLWPVARGPETQVLIPWIRTPAKPAPCPPHGGSGAFHGMVALWGLLAVCVLVGWRDLMTLLRAHQWLRGLGFPLAANRMLPLHPFEYQMGALALTSVLTLAGGLMVFAGWGVPVHGSPAKGAAWGLWLLAWVTARAWMRAGQSRRYSPTCRSWRRRARGYLFGLLAGLGGLFFLGTLVGHDASGALRLVPEWFRFYQLRHTELLRGPSFVLPLLLLATGLVLGVKAVMTAARQGMLHPPLLHVSRRAEATDRSLEPGRSAWWERLAASLAPGRGARARVPVGHSHMAVFALALLLLLGVAAQGTLTPLGEGFGHRVGFSLLVAGGFTMFMVILARFFALWSSLRSVLHRMAQSSYASGFGELGKEFRWGPLKALGAFGGDNASVLPHGALKRMGFLEEQLGLPPEERRMGEAQAWMQRFQEAQARLDHVGEHRALRRLARVLHRCERRGLAALHEGRGGDATAVKGALDGYRAYRAYLFLRSVFAQMRPLLAGALGGLVCLVLGATVNFQESPAFSGVILGLLLVVLPLVFRIFLQMERDLVLSRLSGTAEGRVEWNMSVVATCAKFLVLPLVLLLISRFPQVAGQFKEVLGAIAGLFGT